MCVFLRLGTEPGADLGPLISPAAKQRVCDLVQSGQDEGANVNACVCVLHVCACMCVPPVDHVQVLLDGRGIVVPGYEKGNFVGPTVIADVKVDIAQYLYACVIIIWEIPIHSVSETLYCMKLRATICL